MATLACNLGGAPGASAPPSTTATPAPQYNIPFSAAPIKFTIPWSLATGASAETIDIVTDQTGLPSDVAPSHLQLTLQGYSFGTTSHVPQIFVYPTQQYATMNASAAESLKRLQAALSAPSVPQDKDSLPRVPFYNAGQVFAAQPKVIHFKSGSGVRFITQYAQDISPINNSGLLYHFEGLTDDGKQYIIAVLPVNLPFLAADNDPASPISSEGIPFPAPSASPQDFNSYYRQMTDKIAAAPADRFEPSLRLLDELVASIAVSQ